MAEEVVSDDGHDADGTSGEEAGKLSETTFAEEDVFLVEAKNSEDDEPERDKP